MPDNGPKTVREAVGIFDDAKELEAAAEALREAGFDNADLSVMASDDAIDRAFGNRFKRAEELAEDPRTPRKEYVDRADETTARGALAGGLGYTGAVIAGGTVLALGGPLAPAVAAGVVGGVAGGGVGAALAKVLGERYHQGFEHAIERGGLLLWVTLHQPGAEAEATRILRDSGARGVKTHDVAATSTTVA